MSRHPSISFDLASVWKRKLQYKLQRMVTLAPKGASRGRILLSYVPHPFLISEYELAVTSHTNPIECLEMAEVFLELGYTIDVVSWDDACFIPKASYAMALDSHGNLERFSKTLPPSCKKIFYATGSHWLFQNHAEYTRLLALQRRKGVSLQPRRTVSASKNSEYADAICGLGNAFVQQTYAYASKPIFSLPLPTTTTFSSSEKKTFVDARKHFLWMGGGGAVHKGLDLVLEAFVAMPDYHLTICGPVQVEADFMELYRRELTQFPNIKLVGRINVRGEQFKTLADQACALIYPSCSEGTPGSVVTAMEAGLIPIVSREAGIDVQDFGMELPECSVEAITQAVQDVSNLSEQELQKKAYAAWKHASETFTRERFHEMFRVFISSLI